MGGSAGEFAGPVVQQRGEVFAAVIVAAGDDVAVVGFELAPFVVGRGGDGGEVGLPGAGLAAVKRGAGAHAEDGFGSEEAGIFSGRSRWCLVPACGDYRGIPSLPCSIPCSLILRRLINEDSSIVRRGFDERILLETRGLRTVDSLVLAEVGHASNRAVRTAAEVDPLAARELVEHSSNIRRIFAEENGAADVVRIGVEITFVVGEIEQAEGEDAGVVGQPAHDGVDPKFWFYCADAHGGVFLFD